MILEILFGIGYMFSAVWSFLGNTFYAFWYALDAILHSVHFAGYLANFVHPIIGGSILVTLFFYVVKFILGR